MTEVKTISDTPVQLKVAVEVSQRQNIKNNLMESYQKLQKMLSLMDFVKARFLSVLSKKNSKVSATKRVSRVLLIYTVRKSV